MHLHLLKISFKTNNLNWIITHNLKGFSLLSLLINCMSARSAPQGLSIKTECTFRFFNFLIAGLCDFSANCWSGTFSLLTPLPEDFYEKIYKPMN